MSNQEQKPLTIGDLSDKLSHFRENISPEVEALLGLFGVFVLRK